MAKYGPKAKESVKETMHEFKKGKLKAHLVTTNTFNGAQSVTKVTLKGKKKHRRHH